VCFYKVHDGEDEPVGIDVERLFFIHIMKTAGTSFRYLVMRNVAPSAVYPHPNHDSDLARAYSDPGYLTRLPDERKQHISAYMGHFPYAAVELLDGQFTTCTVLRHPVDRTISFLAQTRQLELPDHSLEQIYENPWKFAFGIHNYQARVFALTTTDVPFTVMNGVPIDDARLALAKARLADVDVLGLQDRYQEFAQEVARLAGWPLPKAERHRVGVPAHVSRWLRRRIEEDNAVDMEFYEYAREIYAER
jgi:Sulfotransferase family